MARALELAFVAVVALSLYRLQSDRVDPSALTQNDFYRWGTQADGAAFPRTIRPHRVIIAQPKVNAVETLTDVIVGAARDPGGTTEQAHYDAEDRVIRITGVQASYVAGLPGGWRKPFLHVLRHEYGHAAMDDWLSASATGPDARVVLAEATTVTPIPYRKMPQELVPVVDEWLAQPQGVYGMSYLQSTPSEYLAESYARLLEDAMVPPKTERFLLRELGGLDLGR